MHSRQYLLRALTKHHLSNHQQTRHYARDPFPNKVSQYFYRANLIDTIRVALRAGPEAVEMALSDRPVDRFVAANALRCAPSANSALALARTLEALPRFSHTQNTVHALATVLARSRRTAELNSLIDDVSAGKFPNVTVSFMNLMQWHAQAGDLDSVLRVWSEYRSKSQRRVCAESYNIVMRLYAQTGNDDEAVKTFHRMIDEGAIPNCRTYKIVIEHLVNSGMLAPAAEVFRMLPAMRIRRTPDQYLLLVEGFVGVKRFDAVRALLDEMSADGILPGRAMCVSLERLRDAGFVEESEEFLREMVPNGLIRSVEYNGDDDDEDDEDEDGREDCVRLKPWLDPRALASVLAKWGSDEVAALEGANLVWTGRLFCKILRNLSSPETAWKFFRWAAIQPGFTHDVYTVQRTMAVLARHGRAELVDELIAKIRTEGMKLPVATVRLIIDFYGLSKKPDAALKVFCHDLDLCGPITSPSTMLLYSSLLRTLTKCARNSEAVDTLEKMVACGVRPDAQTLSGLMRHFALLGDVKTVQKIFAAARRSGTEPDGYTYAVLIKAYCERERAALAWRAYKEARSVGLRPDVATRELLVKSLWKEGKRREAAAVEESCRDAGGSELPLPLRQRGHIWSVSSTDLARVYGIYSKSFTANHVEALFKEV